MENAEKISGIITKSLGGLYTVRTSQGFCECRARGIFRKRGISPCTGDVVEIENGVISEIMSRKNYIIRPPLANLDLILFVVSTVSPSPDFVMLDKFIAIAEYQKITPAVVITKTDLSPGREIADIYRKSGIETFEINYGNSESVNALRDFLKDKTSAFTGNSGAGKSTLINALEPNLNIATGEISEKLGRGRHTTRCVQLYELTGGGYIADTAGFSTFETNRYNIIRKEELSGCFREFSQYIDNCRFRDCSHTCEKGCGVIEAVNSGKISKSRHESYCIMYNEAKLLKDWEL